MRPTQEAHHEFNRAMTKSAFAKNVQQLAQAVNALAAGLSSMNYALRQTYDEIHRVRVLIERGRKS